MIPGVLRIIAWRTGLHWTGWHLMRDDGLLCGATIPERATRCEASQSSGPLFLQAICRRCLRAFANEETA